MIAVAESKYCSWPQGFVRMIEAESRRMQVLQMNRRHSAVPRSQGFEASCMLGHALQATSSFNPEPPWNWTEVQELSRRPVSA